MTVRVHTHKLIQGRVTQVESNTIISSQSIQFKKVPIAQYAFGEPKSNLSFSVMKLASQLLHYKTHLCNSHACFILQGQLTQPVQKLHLIKLLSLYSHIFCFSISVRKFVIMQHHFLFNFQQDLSSFFPSFCPKGTHPFHFDSLP